MQSPRDANQPPPTPMYSIPPRTSGFPRWGMFLLGCGALVFLGFILLGLGMSRFMVAGRGEMQSQFCVDNLRAAHRGLELYSQDYDQTLPRSAVWMDKATPYLKNRAELKCPVVRIVNPTGFGYAFNSKLSGSRTSKIDTPATTALVFESTNLQRNAFDAVISLPSPPRHVHQSGQATPDAAKSGNLIVYADGHVDFVRQDGSSSSMDHRNMRRALFSRPQKVKQVGRKPAPGS
jgi:hypothetical protein